MSVHENEVRARFEKWVRGEEWFKACIGLGQSPTGAYIDPCVNSRWQGWAAAIRPQGGVVELFVRCSRCHGTGQQINGTTGNGPDDTTWLEDCALCDCAGYVPAEPSYLDQLSASGWFSLQPPQPVNGDGGDVLGVWIEGYPDKTYASEWFIAQTKNRDRVVLRMLPEEYSYDYRTADETYIKKENVIRWMQFPDSEFIPFEPKTPVRSDEGQTPLSLCCELLKEYGSKNDKVFRVTDFVRAFKKVVGPKLVAKTPVRSVSDADVEVLCGGYNQAMRDAGYDDSQDNGLSYASPMAMRAAIEAFLKGGE